MSTSPKEKSRWAPMIFATIGHHLSGAPGTAPAAGRDRPRAANAARCIDAGIEHRAFRLLLVVAGARFLQDTGAHREHLIGVGRILVQAAVDAWPGKVLH